MPTQKSKYIRLISDNREMLLSSAGGRILSFSIDGREALLTKGIQTGSTFWPSPQKLWDWPPLAAYDLAEYRELAESKGVSLESQVDEKTQLQVTKTIVPSVNGFQVRYSQKNCGTSAISVAPWEISRLAGGLTFWAGDEPALSQSNGAIEHGLGCRWFEYDVNQLQDNTKIFCNNSAGWLANLCNGLLLIKKFAPLDVSKIAPGEAEIEIYAHGDRENPYIEIEQQGIYSTLQPGEAASWLVNWSVFIVPSQLNRALHVEREASKLTLLNLVENYT